MVSLLQNTYNTRYLLSHDIPLIRSDVPMKMTEDEKQWLIHQNICTIFDLRSEKECSMLPSAFEGDSRFTLYHTPITGANTIPSTPEEVSISYMSMVDSTMINIIYQICHASSGVFYFCSAGKDRTGVVSALLLLCLGVSHQQIIEDYMKSKENLQLLLEDYARNSNVSIDVIMPREEYMECFLKSQKIKNIVNKFQFERYIF